MRQRHCLVRYSSEAPVIPTYTSTPRDLCAYLLKRRIHLLRTLHDSEKNVPPHILNSVVLEGSRNSFFSLRILNYRHQRHDIVLENNQLGPRVLPWGGPYFR